MSLISTILLITSAVAVLFSCSKNSTNGSFTTTSNTSTARSTPTYVPLFNTTETTESALGGGALRINATTSATDLVTTSGTTTHNTGKTTITDGTHSLTDPEGYSVSTRSSGAVYEKNYTSGGVTYDNIGVSGLITIVISDVPTTGTATYTGAAIGGFSDGIQSTSLTEGESRATANFSAGTVNATVSGVTVTDATTGAAATTNGGAAVNVTGANTTTTTQDAFYGYDTAASVPDEVGGSVSQRGDSGLVVDTFIAD